MKIQSIHFDADQKLIDLIHKKIQKVDKVFPKVTEVQVYLKLDASNSGIHQKLAEIKLLLPGKIIFSKEQSATFEESLDLCLENVLSQLKKYKEKLRA